MSELFYVLSSFVYNLLTLLSFLIFIRVVLSWLPLDEDGPIVSFICLVTDPVLLPIRALLDRIPAFANSPIDLSNMFAIMILALLQTFLEVWG
ncbi:MAG: YggT family protein [Clostridia bacterium]|nr:YggT family protein [Clostridia bacterium]